MGCDSQFDDDGISFIRPSQITPAEPKPETDTSQLMPDAINPKHYKTASGIEAIDVIEAFDLDFARANAVKYILRCGKKDDPIQEICKAIWYLERYIQQQETKSL